MSAIDETWMIEDDGKQIRFDEFREGNMAESWNWPIDKLRLAVCAPEAMRVLISNEWECCACHPDIGHSADCNWFAIIKKAGLR